MQIKKERQIRRNREKEEKRESNIGEREERLQIEKKIHNHTDMLKEKLLQKQF